MMMTTLAETPGEKSTAVQSVILSRIEWALTLVILAIAAMGPFLNMPTGTLALTLAIPFALIHGVRHYGWVMTLTFFALSILVSNVLENSSILMGFPFGTYHYTVGPKLFHVPIFVGPFYAGIGYVSWIVALTILDRADEQLDWSTRAGRINMIGLPLLAGAVLTMFDLGVDSATSTIMKMWIWEHGGGFFGVPYTNYLGWWFTTWVFYQAFAVILARRSRSNTAKPATARARPLSAILVYLSYAVMSTANYIVNAGNKDVVIDEAGTSWHIAHIYETLMVVSIFTTLIIALIALIKIAQRSHES